jgi:phospholipid/cholesterol/gamma-HCH transport system substrate-binding protein
MTRLKVQLRRYGVYTAMVALVIVVGTVAGFYILLQERLPSPFTDYYTLNASFSTVNAVVPGLGEPVNVAGVHVGEIAGVQLRNGRGVLTMDIDPGVLPRVYRDAAAALTPNSPLKDMELDILPGHPSAGALPHRGTIPLSETATPIDSDELLGSLDADTRAWFTSLIGDLSTATSGRGAELGRLLRALGPTAVDLHQIGDELAARRHQIAHLVHNLGLLARAAAGQQQNLQTAVDAGDRTLNALASQSTALTAAVDQLPATLRIARHTLDDTAAFAHVLGPTATALGPTVRRLPSVLHQLPTLFRGAALLPARQAIPFIDAVLPLARMVPPLAGNLERATPYLIAAFKTLEYTVNELAYNPGGPNQGFLYWFPWFAHDANSFLSTEDANGSVWRGSGVAPCSALDESPLGPLLAALTGTNPRGSC